MSRSAINKCWYFEFRGQFSTNSENTQNLRTSMRFSAIYILKCPLEHLKPTKIEVFKYLPIHGGKMPQNWLKTWNKNILMKSYLPFYKIFYLSLECVLAITCNYHNMMNSSAPLLQSERPRRCLIFPPSPLHTMDLTINKHLDYVICLSILSFHQISEPIIQVDFLLLSISRSTVGWPVARLLNFWVDLLGQRLSNMTLLHS